MYRRFNLKIDEIQQLKDIARSRPEYNVKEIDLEKIRKDIRPNLKTLVTGTSDEHVVDGEKLKNYIFPTGNGGNYDVFISYSHDDQNDAIYLASWLEQQCGLRVFLDYYIWGNADGLLRDIDNHYCRMENGYYDYNRRNYSTSHVHAMLSMALMDIINNTECCIFINSNHSIHLKKLQKSTTARTLFPWIYEENKLMLLLPSHLARRKMEQFSAEKKSVQADSTPSLKIAHKIELSGFLELTCDKLMKMKGKGKSGLDDLYNYYDLIKRDDRAIIK